jgi:hypothetical protein
MSSMTRTAGPPNSGLGTSTSPVRPSAFRAALQANLALRFAVELASYAALGYWGSCVSQVMAVRVAVAIALPAAATAIWGRFLAPRAPRRLRGLGGLCLELVVFLAAAAAAAASVSLVGGLVLGAVATANALAMRALGVQQ